MKQRRRIYYSSEQRNLMWDRWQKVIIEPNSPSDGVVVAFIEVNGAPVELMQYISGTKEN